MSRLCSAITPTPGDNSDTTTPGDNSFLDPAFQLQPDHTATHAPIPVQAMLALIPVHPMPLPTSRRRRINGFQSLTNKGRSTHSMGTRIPRSDQKGKCRFHQLAARSNEGRRQTEHERHSATNTSNDSITNSYRKLSLDPDVPLASIEGRQPPLPRKRQSEAQAQQDHLSKRLKNEFQEKNGGAFGGPPQVQQQQPVSPFGVPQQAFIGQVHEVLCWVFI
jgi:hypothetical protein